MLRILGFLFLVVIVAAGIAGGVWYHQDRQARQFVENANSRVYADWNTDTLFRNMASVSRSPDRDAWAREFFPMMSEALGPIESSETPEGTLISGQVFLNGNDTFWVPAAELVTDDPPKPGQATELSDQVGFALRDYRPKRASASGR